MFFICIPAGADAADDWSALSAASLEPHFGQNPPPSIDCVPQLGQNIIIILLFLIFEFACIVRLFVGLSQEQLTEMVELTSQHISHTEVASTKISLPALVKIANALHTSVDKLLFDSIHDS